MTEQHEIVALADQFRVAATTGRFLPEFAASYGIDIEPVARSLDLETASFENLDQRISFDRFCRLLEALAALTADEAFGLKYGQSFTLGGSGPFGFGLTQAPTFKDAISFLIKNLPLLADFDVLNLMIEHNRVTIEWSYSPLITQNEQFADFSAVVLLRHLHNCAGDPFRLLGSKLKRRAPLDRSLHLKAFSRNLKFGADINEVVLPHDLLQIANPSADRAMFEYMTQQCQDIANSLIRKKDIVTQLKEEFIENMADDDRAISDVARRVGMSERTLQRRLAEAGTSFWDVFENTRDELSMRLLIDTDLPLSEVGRRVGYSSQSAYTRAVKRWHGNTPAQLRQQHQSG